MPIELGATLSSSKLGEFVDLLVARMIKGGERNEGLGDGDSGTKRGTKA